MGGEFQTGKQLTGASKKGGNKALRGESPMGGRAT